MGRELNIINTGSGDACTYMWACAICDENESCQKDKEGHSRWLVAKRMERIEYKVLIMSNKGGVGKSTCTTNIAVSLALKGWHVGICDMDIHGPNIPKMVGAEGQKLKVSTSGGIIPFQAYNLKIASMSFLLQNSDDPIIWRDAYKYEFINQLLGGGLAGSEFSPHRSAAWDGQRISHDHRLARQRERSCHRDHATGGGPP